MASTLVIYVRHGQTPTTGTRLPGRTPGLHLSNQGRQQAEAVATRLAEATPGLPDMRVTAVYTSPMERARETAVPIARALGLRVRTARGLNECQFGSWTGRRLGDLAKLKAWATVQRQPSAFRFPGGESFGEMQARIVGQVAELVARHPNRAIVCVSHADPIKAALASALGTPLDLFQRITVEPTSVSVVLHRPEWPTVLAVNSTDSMSA